MYFNVSMFPFFFQFKRTLEMNRGGKLLPMPVFFLYLMTIMCKIILERVGVFFRCFYAEEVLLELASTILCLGSNVQADFCTCYSENPDNDKDKNLKASHGHCVHGRESEGLNF